jgi:hypothetical protein
VPFDRPLAGCHLLRQTLASRAMPPSHLLPARDLNLGLREEDLRALFTADIRISG